MYYRLICVKVRGQREEKPMRKILWQCSRNREGGDEARLRWGKLKLGHAADRECRAVGRARSSSAAPRPEGVAARLWSDESAGAALLRPLSTACTGTKIVRASVESAGKTLSGERSAAWQMGRMSQPIVFALAPRNLDRFCETIARFEGRRDLAPPPLVPIKNSSAHFWNELFRRSLRFISPHNTFAKLTKFSSERRVPRRSPGTETHHS